MTGPVVLLVGVDEADAACIDTILQAIGGRTITVGAEEAATPQDGTLLSNAADVVVVALEDSGEAMEMLRRLRAQAPRIPILALAHVGEMADVEWAFKAGADDVLFREALTGEIVTRALRRAVGDWQAERRPNEAQGHLYAVLDTLPMYVFLQGADHRIPFANRTFVELFGEPGDRPCYEVFRNESEVCEECPPARVRQTGRPDTWEWTSAAGRTYAVYDQVFPGSAQPPLTLEVGLDITEQRRAQRELAESEERYRHLFEHAGIGIGFYTPEGILVGFNPVAAAHMGGLPEDFAGRTVIELFGPEKGPEYLQRVLDATKTARASRYEDFVELATGPRWFLSTYSRVKDAEGAVAGVQVFTEDITARHRAQAAVAEWRNRFEIAARASRHVLYDWDAETDEVTYGGDVERVLGYTARELSGGLSRWIELIHPEDRPGFDEAIQRMRATHEPAHLRYRVRHKDGSYLHIEDDGSFISSTDVRPMRMLGFVQDATERRRTAERIEESEWRYRGIFEVAPVGIATVDLKGTITSCNQAFASMTGFAEDELVGKHFTKLPPVRARDVPKYLRLFGAILTGRPLEPFEAQWKTKEGAPRVGEVRVAMLKREGALWGLQVVVNDITKSREAEAELRDSENRYRSLFENAVLGIYQTTPDGRILAANPALVRILGYDSFEELSQRNLEAEGYEPETPRAQFKAELEKVDSLVGHESAWRRRDGSAVYVRENARAVRDAQGRTIYYEGTIEDITERKRVERETEALRSRLELTQYSIDSTQAVVLWVRSDGQLVFANEAACRMLGYEHDELLTKAVWDIDAEYAPEDRAEAWEALRRQGTEVSESQFRTKSGDAFPVEITAQHLDFQGQELEFAVAFDITERRRLESQLRQSQRLESIGTLASGVAHEVNNPLTGIINYAQLLSDRVEDPKLRNYADGIREEGDRVAGIVRNLLAFSRRESERRVPIRISDIVEAALSLCAALLQQDQIELDVEVPEELPEIRCRSQEIQQVMINLLTNARDGLNLRFPEASEEKRISVRGRVLEDVEGRWIRLSVEDTGVGIRPELIDRVFDPFFTTKTRDQGTGLGLSVSYGVVRDHDGRMQVESVPDVFTRFDVDLPVERE